MALIQCKECGKRISDTTEVCVHCGAPTRISVDETASEIKVDMKSSGGEPSENKEELVVFQNLDFDRQCELEKEFWSVDRRAEKYKKRSEKAHGTALLIVGYFFLLLFSLFFSSFQMLGFFEGGWIKNWEIYTLFFYEGFPLFPYLVGITLLSLVIISSLRCNKKKEALYKKQFQRWLRTEKNIEYIPQFNTEREKKIWDSMSINM